jgi:hypothetical protein
VGFLVNGLLGIVLAALTYKALSALPSFYEELQVLGIVEQPAVSTSGLNLIIAVLVALFYTVHPLLGSGLALLSLFLPLALLNVGLAGIYAVFAVLSVPIMAKRGGALLFALVPLILAYPSLVVLLPLFPVLAGLFYRRTLGPYLAGCSALALIVLAFVGGQAAVGTVYVGGDAEPFMESEGMLKAAETSLLPLDLYEDPHHVQTFRDDDMVSKLIFLYGMMQWWVPVLFLVPVLAFLELLPKLLAPALISQFILWIAVAGFVSWLTWLATRRRTVWAIVGTVAAAVTGTLVTAAGHLIISRVFGAPSTLSSVFQGTTSAGLAAILATILALVVAPARCARAAAAQPPEVPAAPMPIPAPGTAAPISAPSAAASAEM